jgi:hypothetical protein
MKKNPPAFTKTRANKKLADAIEAADALEHRLAAEVAQALKLKGEVARLDTEVKKAHARISDLILRADTADQRAALVPSSRVKHPTHGQGVLVMTSRGVSLVDWDNGRTTAIGIIELRGA